MQVTNPGAAWMIALVGMHLRIDNPHVGSLSGEAGIGKSRLTAAVLERLASEPHTRLRYFCSPQHTDSALYPVISQMERAAGFVDDDTARKRLDKLDAVLAQTSTSTEDAALFAEMLSLPNDGRHSKLDLTPPVRERRGRRVRLRWTEHLRAQSAKGQSAMTNWQFRTLLGPRRHARAQLRVP
jgi:predicted ATPase